MLKIKSIIIAIGASILAILSIFIYGFSKGKKEKESEILKEGVKDALETKKREDDRRTDNIDDVIKRVQKYSN